MMMVRLTTPRSCAPFVRGRIIHERPRRASACPGRAGSVTSRAVKVMKFGGSCLQSREGLLRMTELIRSEPRPIIIVLSALKGVTDGLIALTDTAGKGVVPDVDPMRRRHHEVLEV